MTLNTRSHINNRRDTGKTTQFVSRIALACFTALVLSSCLLNRVVEVKSQFCDFESNFALVFEESAEIYFNDPVLLESDILWLIEASPTYTEKSAEELNMIFLIEKVMAKPGTTPDPGNVFKVELQFDRIDDEYKLGSIRMDPKFNAMMNPEFLNEAVLNSAVQNVCDANWSFASTELEMSISDQDLSKLPKRQEILDLLGQPLENFDQENAWVYEFRLISDSKEPSTARFAVWFDESGEMPIRMESRYSRYRTRVDFIEKKMFMKVKI